MTELVPVADEEALFALDQRRAKAYAESGYWGDAKSIAQAYVRLEVARSLSLNPFVAMGQVHMIQGNPELGAGALSPLVKSSGKYDYRVLELTNERCRIRYFERGEPIGDSEFSMDDAVLAGYDKKNPQYRQAPRNMLFARAMSNGVAWFCPDVTGGRVYVPEDFDRESEPYDMDGDVVDDVAAAEAWSAQYAAEGEDFTIDLPGDRAATDAQRTRIAELLAELTGLEHEANLEPTDWAAWAEREGRTVSGAVLTRENARRVIEQAGIHVERLRGLTGP